MKSYQLTNMRNAARRGSCARQLASDWVRLHRPDVWEIAMREATKKFPRAKGQVRIKRKSPMPKSLEKLK